ncbi:MAG: hypothetical protein WCJ66_15170 [Verrucomicrobiota bacterium]
MIRRTFLQLFSGILLPNSDQLAAKSPAPAWMPLRPILQPTAEISHPEWLREWKRIPRLEIAPDDLPDRSDDHQMSIEARLFQHIHNGRPLFFRYLGGSQPGLVRQVLPVQLFSLDHFSYSYLRCEDSTGIPDLDVAPIYLLAWCLTRNAPRTSRLDRIQIN